jgi:HK97 family phage portal protein
MIGHAAISAAREFRAIWTTGGHPRDPALVKILGTQNQSLTGTPITRETIKRYPPVWRGVRLIADGVAKLPLRVFKRVDIDESEGNEPDRKHPAYYLLRHSPCGSDWLTPFILKQMTQSHVLFEGNGYIYIFRDARGAPTDLVPLLPDRTYPIRVDGTIWYITSVRTPEGGTEQRKLPADDVIHIKGLGFDGLCGYSLYDVGRDALGLGLACQDFGCKFFGNGSRASGVFLVPGNIDEEAAMNLRETFDRLHTGIDQSWKVMILEEGIKYEKMSVDPNEGQFLETREFEIKSVANLLGVPPHKLGSKDRTSYNSLEQENQAFLDETLDPWLVNWEEELEQKLLTEDERREDSRFIAFDRDALVRADMTSRYEANNLALSGGWKNRDEVRRGEHLNPIPDGEGKKFLVALNMGDPGGDPAKSEKAPKAPPVVEDKPDGTDDNSVDDSERTRRILTATRGCLVDAITRATKRLGVHARRAAKDPDRFCDWLDRMENEHRAVVEDMLLPSVAACEAVAGGDAKERSIELSGKVFASVHDCLLEAAGACGKDRFEEYVSREMSKRERLSGEELASVLVPVIPQGV